MQEVALYCSPKRGGDAAVSDICEQILKARDQWEQILGEVSSGHFQDPHPELIIVKPETKN